MKSLRRLFSRPTPQTPPAPAPAFKGGLPVPDQGFVAIGDIHGCASTLATLWEKIETAAPGLPIIHVGDYIDRGDDSAGVLAMLHERQQRDGDIVCLRGNHEEMFLAFLEKPEEKGESWLRYGGLQTLASFDGLTIDNALQQRDFPRIRDAVKERLGGDRLAWLAALPASWTTGNIAVVHAGADPRKPLDGQRKSNLTWGHPAFGQLPREDGLWIVHGHTVVDMPVMANGVIAIDTGAYANGRLTAAIFRPDREVEFLQVTR